DRAALSHLAAGALDQHRWPRRSRILAYGRPVAMGGPADTALAHAAVQPPDLRRERHLRPGDRRQEPPQRLSRRGEDTARGDRANLARRPVYERPVPDLLPLHPSLRSYRLDPPLYNPLHRLLGTSLALQGSSLPRLPQQRRLRLPASLRAARARRRGRVDRCLGPDVVERSQAHLRRDPRYRRGPEGGDRDHRRPARRAGRLLLERGVVGRRHG
ncbi:Lycopene elongase, partial [uncultured Rubrobacteraceae bacterium]